MNPRLDEKRERTHVIVYLNSLGFENANFLVLSPFQITGCLTLRPTKSYRINRSGVVSVGAPR